MTIDESLAKLPEDVRKAAVEIADLAGTWGEDFCVIEAAARLLVAARSIVRPDPIAWLSRSLNADVVRIHATEPNGFSANGHLISHGWRGASSGFAGAVHTAAYTLTSKDAEALPIYAGVPVLIS